MHLHMNNNKDLKNVTLFLKCNHRNSLEATDTDDKLTFACVWSEWKYYEIYFSNAVQHIILVCYFQLLILLHHETKT